MKAKRIAAIAFAAVLALSAFTGCQNNGGNSSTPGGTNSTASGSPKQEYNGNDVSQHVDLVHYFVGDKPKDVDVVWDEINKKLKEDINATITLKNIASADKQTKYSLTIGSGETIDVIYTSTSTFYSQEASKGAFAEVTDEVLDKYMPLTKKNQASESFNQASIDGKVYFLPCNLAKVNGNAVIIRGDLREKYGLDKLETIDDLKEYYQKVAENEKGSNIFPYAASQKNDLKVLLFKQVNNYIDIGNATLGDYFYYKYQDKPVEEDDIIYSFEDPAYLEWAKQMEEWSNLGFWSKSAIANTTDPKDSFLSGASASYSHNLGTCGVIANQIAKEHPEWKPEIYDLTPDSAKVKGSYIGDGYAVLEASKNKERSFMYLDLMKHNIDYYTLCRLGIEDVYWTDEGKYEGEGFYGYYGTTDKSVDYPFGNAISWGFKNENFERVRTDKFEDEVVLGDIWTKNAVESPTGGFSFNETPIKNEMSNLNNTKSKYMNLLDLGLSGDVEGKLKEFQQNLKTSGIDKVKEELVKQLNAYNANR